MKSAIYIEDGVTQVVLTPENEWERNSLKLIKNTSDLQIFEGGFYACQGGWYRHNQGTGYNESSLIFRVNKPKPEICTGNGQ